MQIFCYVVAGLAVYAVFVWAVAQALAAATRDVETAYPFTERPDALGHTGPTVSTEGHDNGNTNL